MSRHYKSITAYAVMVVLAFGLTTCKKEKEEKINPPTVKIIEGNIIGYTKASVSAEVTDQGGAEVKSRGFVYGLSGGSLDTVFCGSGTGVYSSDLNNLQPNTTYIYEAFAKNAGGTGTSGKVTFTTKDNMLPTVKTGEVEDISITSASCGGIVTNDGGADVTERGVCWGTSHNPTLGDSHSSSGNGLGEYHCNMTNLSANTIYYIRAYAKNNKGVAYGEEKNFTTLDFDLPEVTTANVTDITQTSAKGGGEVTSDGGATVTERGVCWSTNHNPTVSSNHTSSGTGTGNFTCNIIGLNAHTTYYVRAYATNSKGTNYGEEVSFNTSANLPTVSTGSVTNITTTSALGSGNVTNDGGSTITERGLCWSTYHEPTISGMHISAGDGTGEFTAVMDHLTANTKYYVRAYATNGVGTSYGDEVEFTTLSVSIPAITISVANTGQTNATIVVNVISDGGMTVSERGVCWSTAHNPSTSGNHTSHGSGTGEFTVNITGLTPNTTYYLRAYAINSIGTAYSNEIALTTLPTSVPTVTTGNVTNITSNSATCGGNVTDDGGATVTSRGVCWSLSQNPTVNDSHTINGSGTGSFISQITGLTPNKTYYVRAYATNSAGTSYGSQKTFITNNVNTMPTVTTNSTSNITQTTATSGGNVTSDGGNSVTARGVCWSTSQNPTISNSHTTNGTGTGSFTSNITGLTANTYYYVRAYATNSQGTAYGEQKYFKTSPTVPTVTTSQVTNITQTSATCGGNVTSHGGSSVTARGVCWSTTNSNPTISNSHTTDGSGTGSFTSSIIGLSPGTTYYVRAYATNSAGTGYGVTRTFTTTQSTYVPTVTTNQVTNITQNSATCGGNVVNNGGATITARGVCWSNTTSLPTINNSHTNNGSGMGSFTSTMTGLTGGTTYYVRSYATNSAGTGYGETRTFTTIASKYAYASQYGFSPSGYVKYPINNHNNITSINEGLHLLGGDYYNGYLYAYGFTDENDKYYFYKINATTGSIVSSHYVGEDVYCSDCAYDYTTNRLYGSKGGDLYRINLSTGAQTYVGSFGINGAMVALFCNASGQLYGIETGMSDYGNFYHINKSTGSATLINTLNYYVNYAQSGGFDQETGSLYWAGYVSDSRSSSVELSSGLADGDSRFEWYGIIATINPNTGSVTVLQTNTGEQCAWSIR